MHLKKSSGMSDSSLKYFLQRLALRTQFPPFTWFYRALYAVSIRLCVRRFRRIRGVRSVYLRRGLASGRPVYGLSDIDLLVVVEDDPEGRAAAQVRYQYEFLRRMIPMMAEGELALYDPNQLLALYRYSPFHRNRFEQGRHEWKRLFGDDVFSYLPATPEDTRFLVLQELMPAWYYLAQELAIDDARPLYLRRYVGYKSIADAACTALLAQGEVAGFSREEAIVRAQEAYPQISDRLKEVGKWRGRLLSSEPIPIDGVLDLFFLLVRRAVAHKTVDSKICRKLRVLPAQPEALKMLFGESAIKEIHEACAALDRIERAVLLPRLSFDPMAMLEMEPAAFAGATIDAFDLVLVGQRLPQTERLLQFNRAMNRFRPTVNTFFSNGEVALSLLPIRGRTVKDPKSVPEFFACLSSTSPLEGILEIGEAVEVDRAFEQPDSIEHRAQTLLALFGEAEVYRLSVMSFFSVFWEAGRAAFLAAQTHKPTIEVPVSSAHVVDRLVAITPSVEPVLRRIHQEYWKQLLGVPSDAVRYVLWAGLYALRLEKLLFSSSACWEEPAGQARTELTISVVIITRNQPEFLRQALNSLLGQARRPDQVVVVDNASENETSAVVSSFNDSLNLTLVREEEIGIPHARNAGLQLCTGDIVAYMDGDCEAHRWWLAELEAPFLKDPYIGAVGGSTIPITDGRGLLNRFYESRLSPTHPMRDT
jgi:hypothetical protein